MKKNFQIKKLLLILPLTIGIFASSCTNDFDTLENEAIDSSNNMERKTMASRTLNIDEGGFDVSLFPDIRTIAQNDSVKAQALTLWNQTVTEATQGKRIEHGFWIYYDYEKDEIYCGSPIDGIEVSGTTVAQLEFTTPDECRSTSRVCATFHTHPPFFASLNLFYPKPVGPSHKNDENDPPGDVEEAVRIGLPGLVYDFSRPVWSRDSINSVEPLLWQYGPGKRTASCTL